MVGLQLRDLILGDFSHMLLALHATFRMLRPKGTKGAIILGFPPVV